MNKNREEELLPPSLVSSSRMVAAGWVHVHSSAWVLIMNRV